MSEIVIIGAGAIGRGYLPWVLPSGSVDYIFVDVNKDIINQLNQKKEYITLRAKNNKLEKLKVKVKKAYHLNDFRVSELKDPLAIFICVGPRNCLQAVQG